MAICQRHKKDYEAEISFYYSPNIVSCNEQAIFVTSHYSESFKVKKW